MISGRIGSEGGGVLGGVPGGAGGIVRGRPPETDEEGLAMMFWKRFKRF